MSASWAFKELQHVRHNASPHLRHHHTSWLSCLPGQNFTFLALFAIRRWPPNLENIEDLSVIVIPSFGHLRISYGSCIREDGGKRAARRMGGASEYTVAKNDLYEVPRNSYGRYNELTCFPVNACDPQNFEPNLALNLEIADMINAKKGNAYGRKLYYSPQTF